MVASPSSSRVNFLRRARSSVARASSETFRPGAAASPVPWEFLLAPHSSAGSILRKDILLPLKKPQSSGVVIASLGWLSPKCARVSSARLPICAEKSHRFKRSLTPTASRRLSLYMVTAGRLLSHGAFALSYTTYPLDKLQKQACFSYPAGSVLTESMRKTRYPD